MLIIKDFLANVNRLFDKIFTKAPTQVLVEMVLEGLNPALPSFAFRKVKLSYRDIHLHKINGNRYRLVHGVHGVAFRYELVIHVHLRRSTRVRKGYL